MSFQVSITQAIHYNSFEAHIISMLRLYILEFISFSSVLSLIFQALFQLHRLLYVYQVRCLFVN